MRDFKYNYSKRKFKKIVCKECGLCKGQPKFCYDKMYKNRPYIFVSIILPRLIKIRDAKIHCPKTKDLIIEVFCNQFICPSSHKYNEGCYKIDGCVRKFEEQLRGGILYTGSREIVKPTPSFFCNTNNKLWLEELENYA